MVVLVALECWVEGWIVGFVEFGNIGIVGKAFEFVGRSGKGWIGEVGESWVVFVGLLYASFRLTFA